MHPVTSLSIAECPDSTCEKCKEVKEDTVSFTIEIPIGQAVTILCQDCITEAVSAAVDDGLKTEMIR